MNNILRIGVLSAAVVCAVAYAGASLYPSLSKSAQTSPGLPPPANVHASGAMQAAAGTSAPAARGNNGNNGNNGNKGGITAENVGDVDSFGRNVTWLGVTQAWVELSPAGNACRSDPMPGVVCKELAPLPAATSFEFEDIARFVLPAGASNSLLCHSFSPSIYVEYANPGDVPAIGSVTYVPTLTIENRVLNAPGLVDNQGQPLNGRLTTSMTANEQLVMPLAPGQVVTERVRDSVDCIAGFVSRRQLIDGYRLSERQARDFFRNPTTVRLNVRGNVRNVHGATLTLGMRILGD